MITWYVLSDYFPCDLITNFYSQTLWTSSEAEQPPAEPAAAPTQEAEKPAEAAAEEPKAAE